MSRGRDLGFPAHHRHKSKATSKQPVQAASDNTQPAGEVKDVSPGQYQPIDKNKNSLLDIQSNTVSGTIRKSFVVTIPPGQGDCCNVVGTFSVGCGSYTVVTYDPGCPTSTFEYDWNTCGCPKGLCHWEFVATNCGVQIGEKAEGDEDVDNRPVWTTSTGITGGTITDPTDGGACCVDSEVACSITSATDQDNRYDICGNPQNTTPGDTLTYTWSATGGSWKNGVNTGQSVTWIAPSTPSNGITITCTIDDVAQIPQGETGDRNDASVQRSVTAKVIGGDYSYNRDTVRYYCGSPVPAKYQAVLIAAPSQPGGTTYSWNISGSARIVSGQGTSQCTLEGYGASADYNDISVHVTYTLGEHSCTSPDHTFTSLKPRFLWGPSYTDAAAQYGYVTYADYAICDQLGQEMSVNGSEYFPGDRPEPPDDDWPYNNWCNPAPGGSGDNEGSMFRDTMGPAASGGDPAPVAPNDAQAGTAVFHWTQRIQLGWGVGGTFGGCNAHTHSQQFYRGKGRHL